MDRDKVIKGIDICLNRFHCGAECPYYDNSDCQEQLRDDALALLKEQEAVKPTYEDFFGTRIARCGNCNGYIVRYRYCPGCGKQVKWE